MNLLLSEKDEVLLERCMSRMSRSSGRLKSITIPATIRAAIRRWSDEIECEVGGRFQSPAEAKVHELSTEIRELSAKLEAARLAYVKWVESEMSGRSVEGRMRMERVLREIFSQQSAVDEGVKK